jgi:hypothetical protein
MAPKKLHVASYYNVRATTAFALLSSAACSSPPLGASRRCDALRTTCTRLCSGQAMAACRALCTGGRAGARARGCRSAQWPA